MTRRRENEPMTFMRICVLVICAFGCDVGHSGEPNTTAPSPPGKMVDLDGHRLHIICAGKGLPTVILESGFEEFSFDWILVQTKVARISRVCSYDRAGYAWSDSGPKPRTFVQINLELHEALSRLGEKAPFVLVGHAFGGPIVRNFSKTYPRDVAGVVFVDAVSEEQRFEMWKKAVLMRDGAQGKVIPSPHEQLLDADTPDVPQYYQEGGVRTLDAPFDRLPRAEQQLHLWAQSQRSLAAAEENERTWSPEYFALWHADPGSSRLQAIPLVVLTRAHGGFKDLDISAVQQEAERKAAQSRLVALSTRGEQIIVDSGEDMQIEAPDAVVEAVRKVIDAARQDRHH
jgi:pimeloyl-ACP methyl ester carboxylesterase